MASISRKSRSIFLKQVKSEVDIRLNASLYNQVFIVLDKNKNPGQIEKLGEMIHKVDSGFQSRLQHKDITTVFDQTDVGGRLLILGEPGSGKTTILLKLAEELVKRAQDDHNHPIPVIFSLSSWKKDNQSIKEWLVVQLKEKYGVRKDIGKELIDNQEIIPLLDGLDEIATERQELCVRKMNDFLHSGTWSNPLVVCSRTEEYKHYATLLQLNNSLELCPFTPQQVYEYLQNTDNLQLWDSINNDENLNQLAQTPLLLNIIVLSVQEISIEKWQQFKNSEERHFYLFEAYIRKMLQRKFQGKKPTEEQTRKWLNWLAKRLIKENKTEFFIEKIQPYWLENNNQELIYKIIIYLVFTLFFGIGGLSGALIIFLLYGFTREDNSKVIFKNLVGITCLLILVYLIISPSIYLGSLPKEITAQYYHRWYNVIFFVNSTALKFPIPRLVTKKSNKEPKKEIKNNRLKNKSGKNITLSFQIFCAIFALIVSSSVNYFILGIQFSSQHYYWFYFEFNYTYNLLIFTNIIGTMLSTYCLFRIPKLAEKIQVIETFKWSWLIAKKRILSVIIFGIFYGICAIAFYYLRSSDITLSVYLFLDSVSIFVIGISFSGLISSDIEVRKIPNQGIIASSVNAISVGFFIGLIFGLTSILLSLLQSSHMTLGLNLLLSYAFISGLMGALMGTLIGGGGACLQHFVLRLILYHYDYAPWNYANFLDYTTNCLFLQRVGGSYRFMHDLLRQHFAKYYVNSFEK